MSVLKYRNPETGAFEKVGLPSIGDITPDAIGAATTEEVADAQSTADEAVSAAATAQATAEAAKGDAATAQSTADAAVNNAATAQSTAEAAQTAAEQSLTNAKSYTDSQIAAMPLFSHGTTAPTDTRLLWVDTTENTGGLKYYNGTEWVVVPVAYS